MDTRSLNKIFYKDSLLILINRIFISLSRAVTTFIFAHQLSQTLYGTYQNFWVQFSAIFAISGLSIASFSVSYSPQKIVQIFKDLNAIRLSAGIAVLIGSGLLFASLQSGAGVHFWLAFSFLIFNTLSLILESVMIAFRHLRASLLINGSYFLLFLYAHFVVLRTEGYSFDLLIALLTLLVLAKTILSLLVLRKDFSVGTDAGILKDDKYKKLWRHLYFFDMIQIAMAYSDKFVVSLVMTEATSAVYQNATYVTPILAVVFSAVSSAAVLQFSGAEGDLKRQAAILKNTGRTLSLVAIPAFFFLMFFAEQFITVLYSEKYLGSVPIFRINLLVLLTYCMNLNILLQRHEKGLVINQGMFIDIACLLIFIYPCYQWLGLKGIPLSYFLATVCQLLFYLWHNQNILQTGLADILPLKDWLQKIVVFGLLSWGSYLLFNNWSGLTPFWTLAGGGSVIALAMLAFFNKERKFLTRK